MGISEGESGGLMRWFGKEGREFEWKLIVMDFFCGIAIRVFRCQRRNKMLYTTGNC